MINLKVSKESGKRFAQMVKLLLFQSSYLRLVFDCLKSLLGFLRTVLSKILSCLSDIFVVIYSGSAMLVYSKRNEKAISWKILN